MDTFQDQADIICQEKTNFSSGPTDHTMPASCPRLQGKADQTMKASNIIFKTQLSPVSPLVRERSQQLPGGFGDLLRSLSQWLSIPSQMWRHLGLQLKVTLRWFYFKLCTLQTGKLQTTRIICSPWETPCERTFEVSLEFSGICNHCDIWNSSLRQEGWALIEAPQRSNFFKVLESSSDTNPASKHELRKFWSEITWSNGI